MGVARAKRDLTGNPRSRNFGTAPPPAPRGLLRDDPQEAKFVQSGPVKNARTSGPFGPVPCYATLEHPIGRKDNLLGALSFAHGTKPEGISLGVCTPGTAPQEEGRRREGCIRPVCTALLQDVGHRTALRLREAAARSTSQQSLRDEDLNPPPIFGKSFPLRSSDPKPPSVCPPPRLLPRGGPAEPTALRGKGQHARGARVEQGTARSPVSAPTRPEGSWGGVRGSLGCQPTTSFLTATTSK